MNHQLIDDLEATRTVLAEHGWCQQMLHGLDGRHCLDGAMRHVTWGRDHITWESDTERERHAALVDAFEAVHHRRVQRHNDKYCTTAQDADDALVAVIKAELAKDG
jgi:hypothetical protein